MPRTPNAVEPVLDVLAQNDVLPKVLFADTLYGGDENVQECEHRGVELVSPTAGQKPGGAYAINSDDFVVAENGHEVECCPRGERPLKTIHDEERETTLVVMPAAPWPPMPIRRVPTLAGAARRCTAKWRHRPNRLGPRADVDFSSGDRLGQISRGTAGTSLYLVLVRH